MSEIELSEKLLSDAGGWQAMKEARSMVKAGRVLKASWQEPNLIGEVQGGTGLLKSGLIIEGPIDIENICTCQESRRWGRICGHSIAVGLQVLNPTPEPATPVPTETPVSDPQPQLSDVLKLSDDESDPQAELHIVLPPNVDTALTRGQISAFFEFEADGKRRPLNLAGKGTYFWSENDRAILEWAVRTADGELPAVLPVGLMELTTFLDLLSNHPNVTLGRKEAVHVLDAPYPLRMQATLQDSGAIQLHADLPEPAPIILPGATFWVYEQARFNRLELPAGGAALLQGDVNLSRAQVPDFLMNQWPAMAAGGTLETNFTAADFEIVTAAPQGVIQLEGGLSRLRATIEVRYGKDRYDLADQKNPADSWIADETNPRRYLRRDLAAERMRLSQITRHGFTGPDKDGRWELRGQDEVLRFFATEYPRLQNAADWDVSLQERLDWALDTKVERITPRCEFTPSGEQWLDFSMQFESSGGETFSPADIQRLVLGGQNHTKLRNGKIAILDTGAVEELQEVLVDANPEQTRDGYRLRTVQAQFVASTLEQQNGWQIESVGDWRERLGAAKESKQVVLGRFEKILRPYQAEGVQWLHRLRENGFGGILADEMGLGKTIQALAHLALCKAAGELKNPSLVVCPTTLLSNWAAEAERFAPELNVIILHGAGRESKFDSIADADLVITSYGLVRNDAERYRDIEFDTVLLDEAQHIKNRKTQNAQAVKAIRAQHRFVLTGTPMENSVLDLWSIFDFVMPGYLGSANDFRDRYELPLTRGGDAGIQSRLARRIRPFLLRRLKRDVAKDLPDKIEQVSYCELTDAQRKVYQQFLDAGRKEVLAAVDKNGFNKSRMVIFTVLLRLRQVCCDLRLLKIDNTDPTTSSGKVDLFAELLQEIEDGGHRVLVFSQFTSMLGLLKERLEGEGIEYCYLDGSTRNRGAVVSRFQKSEIPVFLISLKAGGVGLNLTGADTVVHFDPWWNPAIEDQATDRAHRIGQKNVVTSYKLIARDTVEEKILNLQKKKRDAIQSIFGDEEQMTSALDWDEVQDLLN